MRLLRSKLVRIGFFIAIWCLLGAFLYAALDRLPSRAEWADLIAQGGLMAMAVFALCFFAALVLRAVRFGFLTRLDLPLPWRDILIAFPWLFMLGAVTPFRLGEGMRVHWIRQQGGSGAAALGNWAAERWTDMAVLAGFLIIGIATAAVDGFSGTAIWTLTGVIAAGYLLFWAGRPVLIRAASHLPVGRDMAVRLLQSFGYMADLRLHLTVLILTLAIWGLMAFGFWAALSLILGTPAAPAMAVGCVAAVNLIALVSATPGNLVSFQAAMIAVMEAWGHQAVEALMASVIIQSSGLIVAISLGLLSRLVLGGRLLGIGFKA